MTAKALSQVEIIRSLGEALAWFQRELSWGVAPAALPHLTGRIGELYAAVMINGQMATAVNQRGYDVVGKETNQRVSVKTITSSNHVTFRASTFGEVDRIMVLKIDVDGDDVTIKSILDRPAAEVQSLCTRDGKGNLTFAVRSGAIPVRPTEQLDLEDQARSGPYHIKRYVNGTIIVECNGSPATPAMPVLRQIATDIGVSLLNANENLRNTRQLGAEVIAVLKERAKTAS